jgi:O-antigen chain-terminating methyltransferase
MVALLDEILGVLRPGRVVCETPNPKNLLVGTSSSLIDPLHPADEAARLPEDGSAVTERLNRYLYGPQDFAVIGYRA